MDNYQPTHNFDSNHQGEKNAEAQPVGEPNPAPNMHGVTENATTHLLPGANEADGADGATGLVRHARIKFNPTDTCATCKDSTRSNHALELHGREKNHQAFLCTCSMQFKRRFTLDRHIAGTTGPKPYCTTCNKEFFREDKLNEHLRTSHNSGENDVAGSRSWAYVNYGRNGLASSAATTADAALSMLTSTSHHATLIAPAAGSQGLMEYYTGPLADPFGGFHDGAADFPMDSAALQPFGMDAFSGVGCLCAGIPGSGCLCTGLPGNACFCAWLSGANVAGDNVAGLDGNLDMSGMNNGT